MDVDTFAAQRDTELVALADRLRPLIVDALDQPDLTTALLDALADPFRDTYEAEGGTNWRDAFSLLRGDLDGAMARTTPGSDPGRLATWLATAVVNRATVEAAPLLTVKRWVTMRDEAVRDIHRPLDGVRRLRGETFPVGGFALAYPGQPVGPPEVWINCRCVIQPLPFTSIADAFAHDGQFMTPGSKPAPPGDRKKGSRTNKPGSAKAGGSVTLDAATEKALAKKVADFNAGSTPHGKATLRMLKAVWRRGAGAYSTSHRPGVSRAAWAMARVNAFLHLLRSGRPKRAAYTTDNDLLPASHPRASRKESAVDTDTFAKHNLVWREGRRTPIVVPVGQRVRPAKKGEGKVVKTRRATAEEEKAIARGDWVRVAKDGTKPGDKGYMTRNRSRVRPKFN